MPLINYSHLALAALLCMASTAAIAASTPPSFLYRVATKGLLAPPVGDSGGGAPVMVPTDGAPPAANTPVPKGPPSVIFLRDGVQISEVYLRPGTEVQLAIKNNSDVPVTGYLGSSEQWYVRADMTRSTCSQNPEGTTPLMLAPGASCTFYLVEPLKHSHIRPADAFYLRSATYERIPTTLVIPSLELTGEYDGHPMPPPGDV